MSDNSKNRRRALAEVVSVDAWHDEFSEKARKVDLHVDVVFETGRIGGESESPVRFKLAVKQAEIIIIIPESEPLAVEKKSVSRDTPQLSGKLSEITERTARGAARVSAGITLSSTDISPRIAGGAETETTVSSKEKLEVSAIIQLIMITQSITSDGHYRWSLRPTKGDRLEGRPWDAQSSPRLKIVDQRKDRTRGIPPVVCIEVRCRREDLEITCVEIKDESIWQRVKSRAGYPNRLAAAEAYIRDRLAKEALTVKNFSDAFGELTLASIMAEPQRK